MATLKEVWEGKGLSVEEVAAKADVSTMTVYRINKGQHVSFKSLRRVCQAIGITVEEYKALDKGS
jgi:DNA-binding Xre family transcriptional regulator